MIKICVIPGDGVGPEVVGSCLTILKNLPVEIDCFNAEAGCEVKREKGDELAEDTIQSIKESGACLLGTFSGPPLKKFAPSPINMLRRELSLYTTVWPVKCLSPKICLRHPVDLAIVRESTEGLLVGKETEKDGVVTIERKVSKEACERIAKFAFDYTISSGHRKVTCVHKADALRQSDGLFRETFYFNAFNYASRRFGIEVDDMTVDRAALELIRNPQRFNTILTLNMYGEVLSREACALVGGPGVVPVGDFGEQYGVFGPMHDSAPEIAGRGIVNPTSMILAGAMMLRYVGLPAQAVQVEQAVMEVYKRGISTIDVGGTFGTEHFTNEVIRELGKVESMGQFLS